MKRLLVVGAIILFIINPVLLLAILPLGFLVLLALVFVRPFLTRADARRVAVYAATKAYQRYKH